MLSFVLVCSFAWGHSDLGYPEPYNNACKGDQPCVKYACPKVGWRPRNTPQRPFATWRRGQRVEIIWHKNNHSGGFYRRSLVPIKHMHSHEWHQRTAFEYGCWSQGTFKCGKRRVCGKDMKGLAYKNTMVVPDMVPDGVYAFAQAWYGGVDWRLTSPKYSDYYACSFIRIQGGNPVRWAVTPKFVPSATKKKGVPMGKCRTGALRALECKGAECSHKKVKYSVPLEFLNGRKPPAVKASLFGGNAKVGPNEGMMRETAAEEKRSTEVERKDAKEDAMEVREMKQAGQTGEDAENPLEAFKITIAGTTTTLMEGETKSITVNGRPRVQITVHTGNRRPSAVLMKVPGARRARTERVSPYDFAWTVSPGTHRLSATTGPFTLTATLQVRRGNGNGNGSSEPQGCSRDQIPPRVTGSWGPRNSAVWRNKRSAWYKRVNYCKRCKYRC